MNTSQKDEKNYLRKYDSTDLRGVRKVAGGGKNITGSGLFGSDDTYRLQRMEGDVEQQ